MSITQHGNGNLTAVGQFGNFNTADIQQYGNSNTANLQQTGNANQTNIIQMGESRLQLSQEGGLHIPEIVQHASDVIVQQWSAY
ncbi:hypothetical protein DK37_13000 [Halomonas sp. SUBG004]|nr:hypothetical protein DK37_13000 [Halomonas sp. SUBG004]